MQESHARREKATLQLANKVAALLLTDTVTNISVTRGRYESKRARRYIQSTIAVLCTRVRAPNEDDWGKLVKREKVPTLHEERTCIRRAPSKRKDMIPRKYLIPTTSSLGNYNLIAVHDIHLDCRSGMKSIQKKA